MTDQFVSCEGCAELLATVSKRNDLRQVHLYISVGDLYIGQTTVLILPDFEFLSFSYIDCYMCVCVCVCVCRGLLMCMCVCVCVLASNRAGMAHGETRSIWPFRAIIGTLGSSGTLCSGILIKCKDTSLTL